MAGAPFFYGSKIESLSRNSSSSQGKYSNNSIKYNPLFKLLSDSYYYNDEIPSIYSKETM